MEAGPSRVSRKIFVMKTDCPRTCRHPAHCRGTVVLKPKVAECGNAPGCGVGIEVPAQNFSEVQASDDRRVLREGEALGPLWPLASVPPPIGVLPIATP